MRVGFTGTRDGMTDAQKDTLSAWLARHRLSEFHHGNAVGADEDAVRELLTAAQDFEHLRAVAIHAHPCGVPGQGSAAAFILSHVKHKVAEPLVRNRAIVAACDVLLAAPKSPHEERRSGTWAAIREARRRGKRVLILNPDGTTAENPP